MADPSGIKLRVVDDEDIPTPATGKVHFYFNADGPSYLDDAGVPHSFAGVTSFNGRAGAVSPLAADYDAFFLTPAEGDAAYDPLGAAAAAQAASQPLDADLTAISALTTTSFGRSFLALADAAAGRTLLALGTAAVMAASAFDAAGAAAAAQAASQPLDSDLTAIAALTTTSYGRSFLPLADATAGRTLLGLGTASTAAVPTSTGLVKVTSGAFDAAASLLVNADVATGAAVAGTKIAPDFGSQAVVTTGTLGAAATTLSSTLSVAGATTLTNLTGTGTRLALASSVGLLSALANTTDGYVLTLVSGAPAWAVASGGTLAGDVTGAPGTNVVEAATGAGGLFNVRGTTKLTFGSVPATAGTLRMENGTGAQVRNAANSANLRAWIIDTSDVCILGNSTGATQLNGLTWALQVAGTTTLSSSSSQVLSAQPVAIGTNTATAGSLRLGNTGDVQIRNAANGADLRALTIDASNVCIAGNSTGATQVNGLTWALQVAGTTTLSSTSALVSSAQPLSVTGAITGSTTIAIGTTPATAGDVRLSNSGSLNFRNAGNSANILGLTCASATFAIGDDSGFTTISYRSSTTHQFKVNTVEKMRVEAGGASINGTGSYGGGVGVMCLLNASTATTGNPTNATVLSSVAGIFTVRGSAAGCVSFENPSTSVTVGAAGVGAALPLTPTAYLVFKISGTDFKVPYYAS